MYAKCEEVCGTPLKWTCENTDISIFLTIYLSVLLSVYENTDISIFLSIYLSICLSMRT